MTKHLGKVKRIGALRKRVILQTFADAISGTAALESTFTNVATIWANVRQLNGIAADRFKNLGSNFTHEITIKYRSDVSSENWIEYDGHIIDTDYVPIRWGHHRHHRGYYGYP